MPAKRFFLWLAYHLQLLLLSLGGRSYGRMLLAVVAILFWSASFYYLGHVVEHKRFDAAFKELALIEGFEDVLEGENAALKLFAIKTQANLLRETARQMRGELRQKERDLAEIREQLYFYRKVIAPEDLPKGVSILSAQLEQPANAGHFSFELVLRASGAGDKTTKGNVRLRMTGTVGGVRRQLPMSAFYQGDKQFSFKYFQRLKGRVSVPQNFAPSSIEIDVQSAEFDPLTRSFAWRNLLSQADR